MNDPKQVTYVPPKPEVIERYSKNVCQAMTERGKNDCTNPEIAQGLAQFLRVLFRIQAQVLNGELKG